MSDEYEVCQRRGHLANGRGFQQGTGPFFTYCRWCGVPFTVETVRTTIELVGDERRTRPAVDQEHRWLDRR